MRAQVHGHVLRELVDADLLRAIGRAMHVAARAERGGEHDQPAPLRQHQRGRMPARDIGRAQADIEDVDELERLGPEAARLDELVVQEGRVVDEDVDVALLLGNAREQRRHLCIIAVIAGHGDAATTGRGDFGGRGVDGARQRRIAFLERAAGHVDGRAFRAQRAGDAEAGSARGAGDDGDHALQRSCFIHAVLSSRVSSLRSSNFMTLPAALAGNAPTTATERGTL